MKPIYNRFVGLLFFISVYSLVQAQEEEPSVILRAGPTLNRLRGNTFLQEYHRPILAYYGGVDGKLPVGKHTNLVAGLAYQVNGSQTKKMQLTDNFGNILGTGKTVDQLHYLTFPLLVEFAAGSSVRVNFQAGIFGSYLLKHVSKLKVKEGSMPDSKMEMETLKKGNGGLVTGLGVEIPMQHSLFVSFQFRNQVGLLNISKEPVMDDGAIRTNSNGLLIGIGWRL